MKLGPKQQAWVDALRSGNYEQGKGYLRVNNNYCCLGVACEITKIDECKISDTHHVPEEQIYLYGDILSKEMYYGSMPEKTQKELKLKDSLGFIDRIGISLASMNDGDYSFLEIADKIEEYSDDLFLEPA